MRKIFTAIFLISSFLSFSQFETLNVTITDNQINSAKYKKMGTDCNADTLQYGRFKARSLRPITASLGYSLGQLYSAPGEVEVSGFTFYAWFSGQNAFDDAKVFCHIYAIDSDSLPTGNPLRADTLDVDTAFQGGQLAFLERHATFSSPITFDKPFIIVVGVVDSGRLAVVCNDWTNNEGREENLLRGTVGGNTWYKGLNLNIAGRSLDCDVLLEPHVSYSISADFEFDDCYNFRDTVKFSNTSSGFIFDPMYNRWAFSNNTRISNMWNYGHNTATVLMDSGAIRYPAPGNYSVRLINRLLHFKNGTYCYDTIVKPITFMPDEPILSGTRIDSVCSGDSSIILAQSNGELFWYRDFEDTTFFQTGNRYRTGPLMISDTVFLESVNEVCKTERLKHIVKVNQIPTVISTSGDSICQGASANLSAEVDFGQVDWYAASSGSNSFYTGNIYVTSTLFDGVTYYVEGNNSGCRSANRTAVTAEVGTEFAPDNPDIFEDSMACRKDGDFWLYVNNPLNQIRWYNQPAGGTPVATGDSLFVSMVQGINNRTVYVDAFDGRCPSTRVPVSVDFIDIPSINIDLQNDIEVCLGQSVEIDLNLTQGSVRWFPSAQSLSEIFDGNVYEIEEVMDLTTLYLEPYNNICIDDNRYPLNISPVNYGIFNHTNRSEEICENKTASLQVDPILGDAKWFSDETLDDLVFVGNSYTVNNAVESKEFYVVADNKGCISLPIIYELSVNPKANATFDFDILAPGNFRFSANVIGQGFYVWDLGDGNTGSGGQLTHQYKSNGEFEVSLVVIPSNECNDTFSRTLQVSGVVSIQNILSNNISIYPNPTTDWLQIKLKDAKPTNAMLIDTYGKTISEFIIEGDKNLFLGNEISNGIYYLIIENHLPQKIIKY